MFPTRWLLPFPLAIALVFGGCARRAYTSVRSVAPDQLSRGNSQRLFDALHVHCWQVDLPAVTGDQYVVVKIDVQLNGKPGMSSSSRMLRRDRSVVVAVSGEPTNQRWFIVTSAGNGGFTVREEQPAGTVVELSPKFFNRRDVPTNGSVLLAHWEYRDGDGKQIKTIDAMLTVEKRVGAGMDRVVP